MTTHARLSPSARHRWARCPGSVREEAKYPEESNATADDGTHTHTLLDWCLKNEWAGGPMTNLVLEDHVGKFTTDEARNERVQFALSYIKSLPGTVYSDVKSDPFPYVGRNDMKGTADVMIEDGLDIEIIDYKDGMSPVDAKDNEQMELYALGKLEDRHKTVRMTIIQPKLRVKGMTGISTHKITADELRAKVPQIIAEAAATDDPNAPLVPGEVQCKYCKAKGTCTALVNSTLASSGITFENLSKEAADVEPTTLTDERIREILEAAPLIRQMIEGVEKEALRRFEAGLPIAGLKAVRGRGSRAWALEDDVIAEKLKKMGLPKDTIWKATLISPAQAEKVTWEKRDGSKMQLSERQVTMLRNDLIKKSDGKLTIVAESDERPAVVVSAAGMFADLSIPSFLQSL